MDRRKLAAYIDHTELKPTAGSADIRRLCSEGNSYGFASLCLHGSRLALAKGLSRIPLTAVIGFPLGAVKTALKVEEAKHAVMDGAAELDMVINLGWAKDGAWDLVEKEIGQVVQAVPNTLVKVIIETALLNQNEKVAACRAVRAAGAGFVKTSTGFAGGGATVADVRLLRAEVGPALGVKAAGGIRDLATAMALIKAGATRLGCSAGVSIVEELLP